MTNGTLIKCNTFDMHLVIIGLEKQFLVFLRMAVLHRFHCKTCFKRSVNERHKICFQDRESAKLPFCTKLPPVIKTFVLSIVEWPFYTDFPAFGI